MQNHLRVIQEQAESQVESRTDQEPQSPVSGVKMGTIVRMAAQGNAASENEQ